MLRACKNCAAVLEMVSTELQEDRELVTGAMKGCGAALAHLPFNSQRLYPDLVAVAIANIAEHDETDECLDFVAEDLWANIDVANAWLAAGGTIHYKIPQTILTSREFGLLVADHCLLDEFKEIVSESCRSVAIAFVRGDFHSVANIELVVELFSRALQGLSAHDNFFKGLLCGMSFNAGSSCRLIMLEQGAETSLALKKRIAEFVGVPTGTKLRLLRRVTENLRCVVVIHRVSMFVKVPCIFSFIGLCCDA